MQQTASKAFSGFFLNKLRKYLLFILISFLQPCLVAQNLVSDLATQQADSIIKTFLKRNQLPAISVSIAVDNQLIYSSTQGMADLQNQVPANNETLFRIASVTKPITAMAILKLAEDGLIDLDDSIDTYCSVFDFTNKSPSVRELLAHLGGLPDYSTVEKGVWKIFTKGGKVEGSNPFYFNTIGEAIETVMPQVQLTNSGEKFIYSNIGYLFLGCAIEEASGKKYPEYLRDHLFPLAKMTRTRPDDIMELIGNRALAYQMRSERTKNWWWWTKAQKDKMKLHTIYPARYEDLSIKTPAGGLLSTSAELIHFVSAFNSNKLINAPLKEQMLNQQMTAAGDKIDWGLGFVIGEFNREPVFGLSGGQPGASAVLRSTRDGHFAIAIITNRDLVQLNPLIVALGQIWGHFKEND